jgi:prepilin-type N-terminal cleavage/methylation domain-containing protein
MNSTKKGTFGVWRNESGFTLPELLISILILLVLSSAVFSLLNEIQRTAVCQAEVQSVTNNARLAMNIIGRYIRQAGNDPLNRGLTGITIINATELHIHSDIAGAAIVGNPDKGDPDGDIDDSGENITIRYNRTTRSLEVVPEGSPAQIIAGNISDLAFKYFDDEGNLITTGNNVQRINVTVTGTSSAPDPQTHNLFGIKLSSDFRILS